MIDLNTLSTEKNNENSSQIELQNTTEILTRINNEDKLVALAVEKSISQISQLVDAIINNYHEESKNRRRIIYVGAGTSGRIGILDASECPPTYGVDYETVIGIIAGGNEAIFKAKENAEDNELQGEIDLQNIHLTERDVVIGIAASGRTPYVIGALNYANRIGAITGSISCSAHSKISKIAQFPIEVIVGPEIITGSTRMKAGTAQKLVLNMISTTVMIKLGKVFSGYMVDVKTSNLKLIERAKNIIMQTTGVQYEIATKYLENSNNDVKTAIAMILLNVDKENAIKYLNNYNGNIAKLIHDNKKI